MSADTLWYKDAVFSELHVKTFQDSSNDGGGDSGGLIQRLDVAGCLSPHRSVLTIDLRIE